MRNHGIVPLIVTGLLAACSVGQYPPEPATIAPPPAPQPTTPPVTPAPVPEPPPPPPTPPPPPITWETQPPFPALPTPPAGPLLCSPCKKIAFVSARDGNPEIYSVNADGTELTRLTDDSSNDEHPAWSPDGKRIAFLSDRGGDHLWYDVYVVDADGSNIQRMTSSRRAWQDPSWSPDGKSITFSSSSDGSSNLWQVPATGGTPTLQFSSPGYDGEPSWSPDGTRLAFDSDYFLYDFGTDIFLVNANGSGFRVLTDGVTSDSIAYTHPSWSPDGSRLALRVNRDLYAAGYITWVGVMNADGSGLTLLTSPKKSVQEVFEFGATTWSPDGTTIAYTSCDEAGCNVAWVRADGSAQGTLINGGWNPSWQP